MNAKDIMNKWHIRERLGGKPRQPAVNTSLSVHEHALEEAVKPNTTVRVVDDIKKVIGEKPPVTFKTLVDLRNETPQLDTIIGFETDMIVGTDLNINADNEEAKELCEDFANETALYDKVRNHTNTALTTGFGILVRVRKQGLLTNIEEFDITSLEETYRDEWGNTVGYLQRLGGEDYPITDVGDHIPLIFKKNGRSAYGLSEFHAMAVNRTTGNRTTRPLAKALQSLDDVVIGTLENFAFPIEYHTYEGANTEQLEEEARKYKERKPGDVFFINRPHEIDRREPTQAKFEPFFQHFNDLLQHGTGFPLDMLTGDFTSRASSETADSFFMRKIRSYQKGLTKLLKAEIFEELLRSNGWDEEKIEAANIVVEFEVKTEQSYTPEIVTQRVQNKIWTTKEAREYDKSNGQDLFDDDKIEQEEEENRLMQQQQFDMQQQQAKDDDNKAQKKTEAMLEEIKHAQALEQKYSILFEKLEDKSNKVREAMAEEHTVVTNKKLQMLEQMEEKLKEL